MANTIAKCFGIGATKTSKEAHRCGSNAAHAEAATWRTFATAHVLANGSGYVEIKRDGVVLHRFDFGAEPAEPVTPTVPATDTADAEVNAAK